MDKKELRAKLVAELREMDEKIKAENRSYTDDENKIFSDKTNEVRKLSEEIAQEEREALLNGFSTELPKPQAEEKANVPDDVANFRSYLMGEKRDLSVGSGGGALAPEKFVAEIIKDVEDDSPLYNAVRKFPLSSVASLGAPYESADASDADWTAEVPSSEITADSTLAYAKRELSPNALAKLIKVSDKLIKASAIPVEQLIKNKLTEKITSAFENGIISGTGNGQPLGVFVANEHGVTTDRDVATENATISADDIIKTKMKLKAAYRRNAKWVMSTAVLTACLLLKDKNDQYLWRPGLTASEPDTLLGVPVIESAYAPTAVDTAGTYVAVIGDFSYYWWAYYNGIEVQNLYELFSLKNQKGFKALAYADGAPVLPDAFARLQIKA